MSSWSQDLPGDLKAADDARYSAMMANDTAALERLLSDDLSYTHSDGQTDSKASYLAQLKDGRLRYRRFELEALNCLALREQALVRGALRLEARFQGREVSIRIHYLAVWIRREGAWRLVAWASTRLPEVSPEVLP